MSSKFISIMDKVGHDIKIVWEDVEKYLPAAEQIALMLFGVKVQPVIDGVNLIQKAVVTVEQKFAATGNPTGTGPQKLAQVLSIVGPAVTNLLAQAGLHYNQTEVESIVNAVVGVLNVPSQATA